MWALRKLSFESLASNMFSHLQLLISVKTANAVEVVPLGGKTHVDGWHIIQFAGGKKSPTKIHLNLIWTSNATDPSRQGYTQAQGSSKPLLKLRTDVNLVTPPVAMVLEKLPIWCSLFGKSNSPFTFAFLTSLPVRF